ncbi:beta-phenylalanine transaminase [Colletotrichum asianum]|uniref:Beta-phenylalanine transaminase n=1 Tax=Colletotrichum asianum TaxID=702518 RepID=A0A8H3W266_9PEZI|nr:beta-phenylalanine transaminase [Colletotrichum asianum]
MSGTELMHSKKRPSLVDAKMDWSLVNRFPSIDKIRFCNSGTEANILATCLGLAFTRRKKVLGFNNGYHGAFTHFGSAGNSLNIPFEYAVGQYNVTSPNDRLLSEDIGVIILEPMQGAGGMLPASKGFLQWARHAADRIGAVLVFDELITSRLHIGGLQTHFDVYPDLTTLGKYVGGGFGFGACGGRADIMALLNPGGLFHSGTYNNDTFTMAAGVEAGKLLTRDKIAKANDLGDILRDGINIIAKRYE